MRQRKRNKIIRSLIKAITPDDGSADEGAIVAINDFIDLLGNMDQEEFWGIKHLIMSCYLAGMKSCLTTEETE